MELILLGYMGSGKSTIGHYLSKKMHLKFIDLDAYIEDKEQMTILEIFSIKGEIYFRLQEAIYLEEIISTETNYILSLGGGTPCYGNNLKVILESNIPSFYLKNTIPTLVKRLEKGKETRPLIADLNTEQLTEYIGKHLFERAPYYEQSKYKVAIDDKSLEEVYCDIAVQLH